MPTIVTRAGKGTPLTNTEMDDNFTNLNNGFANYQPLAAILTDLAALTQAANKGFFFDTSTTAATFDFTAGGRALVGLTPAADQFAYWSSASVAVLANITAGARAAMALTYAADRIVYWTSASAAAVTTLSAGARAALALTMAADTFVYWSAAGTAVVGTITATGRDIIDSADAAAARTALGLAATSVMAEMTTAEYWANTADKLVTTDRAWASMDLVTLTSSSTITPDLNTGINFSLTIGHNATLANPTNAAKIGQSGSIRITQDGTGSRTLAYGTSWKFAGGTDPVLSTVAGTVDILHYKIWTSTFIEATLVKGVA
jgi:hypothetical protein